MSGSCRDPDGILHLDWAELHQLHAVIDPVTIRPGESSRMLQNMENL